MANTITLLNAMKSVFAGLGAKTTDSNYGVALLDKTSGEPKGFMGMSDLASVLGGLINGGQWGHKDLNNAPDNSIVDASPITTGGVNYPSGAQRGFTITRNIGGLVKWQEFYEKGGEFSRQIIAIHYRTYVADTWYNWLKVDLT